MRTGRCFSRTIRSDKAVNIAFFYFHIKTVQGICFSVFFGQFLNFQYRHLAPPLTDSPDIAPVGSLSPLRSDSVPHSIHNFHDTLLPFPLRKDGTAHGSAAPQYEKAVKGTGGNPGTGKKSVEAVAKEVIAGKWGNGEDRKKRLQAAGYDYPAVQAKVNELVKSKVYGSRNERTSCKAVG